MKNRPPPDQGTDQDPPRAADKSPAPDPAPPPGKTLPGVEQDRLRQAVTALDQPGDPEEVAPQRADQPLRQLNEKPER